MLEVPLEAGEQQEDLGLRSVLHGAEESPVDREVRPPGRGGFRRNERQGARQGSRAAGSFLREVQAQGLHQEPGFEVRRGRLAVPLQLQPQPAAALPVVGQGPQPLGLAQQPAGGVPPIRPPFDVRQRSGQLEQAERLLPGAAVLLDEVLAPARQVPAQASSGRQRFRQGRVGALAEALQDVAADLPRLFQRHVVAALVEQARRERLDPVPAEVARELGQAQQGDERRHLSQAIREPQESRPPIPDRIEGGSGSVGVPGADPGQRVQERLEPRLVRGQRRGLFAEPGMEKSVLEEALRQAVALVDGALEPFEPVLDGIQPSLGLDALAGEERQRRGELAP